MRLLTSRRVPALLACALAPVAAHADNRAAELEAPKVEVVGTTPLPAIGMPKSKVPANIQVITAPEIGRQRAGDVTEFLDSNAGSISLNSAQGNTYQPDVNFRGFTASHLLGVPQGLSVFMDGVRINESFGDTVNWDLIPQSAISSITLMPGSNPQFGLNTLGGSLAVMTKSGFQYPGFTASAWGGSYGRKAGSFEWGGHGEKVDYFLTGNYLEEDGWRDYSSSNIRNLFGKIGYQDGVTDLDVSLSLANNRLEGTQALPQSYLANRAQAYTWPDRTKNELAALNARLSHFLNDALLLSGNIYYRERKQRAFASNVNDGCSDVLEIANCVAGTTAQGSNDSSLLKQTSYGMTGQVSYLGDIAGMKNQLAVGASADLSGTRYDQSEQDTNFDSTRGTTLLLDDFQQQTGIRGSSKTYGLYATNTLSLTDTVALTAAGRFNRANVVVEDRLGNKPDVAGDHTFNRFNPAFGATFSPSKSYTSYVNYSEGMRAPTPVELTCANANAPCPLPNAFLADPPLKPVVSRTYEVGARGTVNGGFSWNTALFRTDLRDDIQFISAASGGTQLGYFDNVGKTRRQGFELGGRYRVRGLALSANYTFLRATFETPFVVNSPNNSTADGAGQIQVNRGNRMPNIPDHSLKLRADYAFDDALSIGANLIMNSTVYARGDENNQDANGKVKGYRVVNLDARYQLDKSWQLFVRINNVFDRKYENFGILGENFFPGGTYNPGAAVAEPFYGVGAPRGIWIGVRYDLGRVPGRDND